MTTWTPVPVTAEAWTATGPTPEAWSSTPLSPALWMPSSTAGGEAWTPVGGTAGVWDGPLSGENGPLIFPDGDETFFVTRQARG